MSCKVEIWPVCTSSRALPISTPKSQGSLQQTLGSGGQSRQKCENRFFGLSSKTKRPILKSALRITHHTLLFTFQERNLKDPGNPQGSGPSNATGNRAFSTDFEALQLHPQMSCNFEISPVCTSSLALPTSVLKSQGSLQQTLGSGGQSRQKCEKSIFG